MAFIVTSILATACGGSSGDGVPVGGSTDPTDPNGSGQPPGATPPPTTPPDTSGDVDLRADTNRDGVVSFDDASDDDGEEQWDAKHGAVFLANIDDEEEKCPTDVDEVDLPKFNDAADDVINGAEDLLDLARLKTKPWLPRPTAQRRNLDERGRALRLFKGKGTSFTALAEDGAISLDELRAGVELGIEARDIVRDTKCGTATST